MEIRRSASRLILGAALALVTIGCGSNSGATASSAQPATPAAPATGGTSGVADGGASATGGSDGGAPTAGGGTPTPSATPHAQHKRCAWIGADTFAQGKAAFLANPDWFDAIHPVWYTLNPDATVRQLAIADDADIMAAAHAHGVKVIPLVDGNTDSYMRTAMATPDSIAAHAAMLATLADQHGYDGLEMDYEHLWSASDRAPYVALVAAVAAKLHAAGKVLTLAVPSLSVDNVQSAYDYKALQKSADVLHLMGYDFHYLGADHLGPIAPKGWITDVVTYVQSLGAPQRFVLGIANYGIGNGWYASGKDAIASCIAGTYTSQTDHMSVCTFGHQEAGLAPHCDTAQGPVWFEDAGSAGEKAALAKAHGLGGVAYYTLGDEPTGFFDALAASY
jgi:spore germination protein YaaH